MKSDPTPPTRCQVCGKAYALKRPDPDGGRRCFSHSTDPLNIERQRANGAVGTATAATSRGVKPEDRKGVLAGVVDLELARERAKDERKAKKEAGDPDPIPLRTKDQQMAFVERCAGRFAVEGDAQLATGASALVKAVLAIQGVDTPDDDEEDAPRTFTFETTKGDKVPMAGRETAGGN